MTRIGTSSGPKSRQKKIKAERRIEFSYMLFKAKFKMVSRGSVQISKVSSESTERKLKHSLSFQRKVGAININTVTKFSPVLVEATLALDVDVLSPDGLERTEATRGLDVANHTDSNQWRSFDDGDGLDNFTGTALGSGAFDLPDDVGHTGLEAEKSRKMDGLLGVILGEGLNLTAVAAGALLRVESHRAMTRRRKLTVRLEKNHQLLEKNE